MGNNISGVNVPPENRTNSWFSDKMKNNPVARNVLMTLGALGVMATTDTNAQNIGGSPLPPSGISTGTENAEEVLTKEEIINILQSNKDKLTKAYPSLNDEATWLRVIGAIATGVSKKETTDYLAAAFEVTSNEHKKLISFGKKTTTQKVTTNSTNIDSKAPEQPTKKPAIGSKEDQEQKKLAAEKARIDKLKPKLINDFNSLSLSPKSWTNAADKDLDGKITAEKVAQTLTLKLPKGKKKGRVEITPQVPPQDYELDLEIDGGKLIFWSRDENGDGFRLELASGKHKIKGGQGFRFGIALTEMFPLVHLKKMELKPEGDIENKVVSTK